MGFPVDAPTVYDFPREMMAAGSDLSPINENIDKIVYGLTKWQPKVTTKGVVTPAKVTVTGKNYSEAVANMNNLFLKNSWGDGLPIVPPTEEQVNWILTGTDLARNTLVGAGKIQPRGAAATVESLAVNLAMAGGRPEYLPVLIAIVEALTKPELGDWRFNPDTNNTFPAVAANGPMTKQIRLNSGYGAMGPDPAHPAGASIGRALRLILQNLGGAIPGNGSAVIQGTPARYTNAVFAEDEDGLPKGWDPLNVELGFPKGSNVVTLQIVCGASNILAGATGTKEVALANMSKWGAYMASPTGSYFNTGYDNGSPGFLVMARGTAKGLADLGYSKLDVKTFLWNNSKILSSMVAATGMTSTATGLGFQGQDLPITKKPQNIMFVVAGGAPSAHVEWLPTYGIMGVATSAEIKLPKNWNDLLKVAETDLGPLPPPMLGFTP
jgi:hypothetical protein